ncbi:MAG: hypothetical protein CMF11_02225 [Idiomarina sp.]|nr:hypothetical protein [Idiomarina sp.]
MLTEDRDTLTLISFGTLPDGVKYLEVAGFDGPDGYRALPRVVKLKGERYGRTGWDSDRKVAFYRTDAPMADIER